MTLPEDVREKLIRNFYIHIAEMGWAKGVEAELASKHLAIMVDPFLTSAKAEGIAIGLSYPFPYGLLQYQDGYKAGKAEGYAEAKTETAEFAGKILTAAQQANQDQREVVARSQGYQEGVKAMQEAVKERLEPERSDTEMTQWMEYAQGCVNDTATQLLNPQEEKHE